MGLSVLLLALSLSLTPAEAASRYLTGIAAQGAAGVPNTDVVTSTDLRTALDLEAQKQLASCDASSSCMAEIAAALDAQVVIAATLLSVGEGYTLQVSAYDVKRAASAGRKTLRSTSIDGFSAPLEETTRAFLLPLVSPGAIGPGGKVRVLVLDVDGSGMSQALASSPSSAAASSSSSGSRFGGLAVGGGVVAGLGVLGAVVGGVLLGVAESANAQLVGTEVLSVAKQNEALTTRDRFLMPGTVLLVGGVVLALGGAGAIAVDGASK